MTMQETGRVMDALESAYPRYYAGIDKQRRERAVIMWASAFSRDDVRLVVAAVESFIATDTKGFPPVPGQIKAKIHLIAGHGELSDTEAWNMVRNAIRNSGHESREEFEKLPPPIQKLVGNASQLREWALMERETLNSVVSSNFLKAYRTWSEREREYNALPPDVRELVAQLAAAKAMPELPGKKADIRSPEVKTANPPECIGKIAQDLRQGRIPVADIGKGGNQDGE